MSTLENTVVRFARVPDPGPLTADVFTWEKKPVAPPQEGELLVRTIYLSIDAGSRAQLDDRGDYVIKATIGKVIGSSGAVAEVVESRHPDWRPGDLLATTLARWQRYQTVVPDRQPVFRVDPKDGPIAMHLGTLGMVGFTAYIGIMEVAKPQPGETVLISAAAGATGALAGQFAKISGARVVGIAGGWEKCAFVKSELGFDDCIDYKHGDIRASIRAACPDGIDVYYENVGGEIQKAAFEQMNDFGRIAMCGMVGQYSGEGEAPGPNLMFMVLKRITMRGFLAGDHMERHQEFIDNATRWYRQGRLKHHATVTKGLENIHEAINSLTAGRNVGKQLCQVGDEPG
jgi:NADPH-dependent curcumin reductase CurA